LSLTPKLFIDEKIRNNNQTHFIEKVLHFVDFCQVKIMKNNQSFDKRASCSFIATVMRMIRKNEFQLILNEPENYGIPHSICKYIEEHLESNSEIFTLVQQNVDLCQKIEKILLLGDLNVIRSGASQTIYTNTK